MYYIAYGSNTPQEMVFRAPDSKFIGVATLRGYRLEFSYYATIRKRLFSKTRVALYEISERDEELLDRYESFPVLYKKKMVKVRIAGKKIEALVYIMTESYYECNRTCALDASYVERIRQGYKTMHIPRAQLFGAVRRVGRRR